MPSFFRRKSTAPAPESPTTGTAVDEAPTSPARTRARTLSKKELGRETPKRPTAGRRPVNNTTPLSKEEARQRRRELRSEAAAEFRREGGPRDRGPERLLARNVVDSRRTVGTWFFGGALVMLVASSPSMPVQAQIGANVLWVVLAVALVIDSVLISRRIRKLVRERYPKSTERMGSLYLYAIMRSITFRRMRAPIPRVRIGDKI